MFKISTILGAVCGLITTTIAARLVVQTQTATPKSPGFDWFVADHWSVLFSAIQIWFAGGSSGRLSAFITIITLGLLSLPIGAALGGWILPKVMTKIAHFAKKGGERSLAASKASGRQIGSLFSKVRDLKLFRPRPGRDSGTVGPRNGGVRTSPSFHIKLEMSWGQKSDTGTIQDSMPRPNDTPAPALVIGAPVPITPASQPQAQEHDEAQIETLLQEPAILSESDIRARVATGLSHRGWEVRSNILVDANAGDGHLSEDDPYDADPHAIIPLIALSEEELALIFPISLKGKSWVGTEYETTSRGIPTITAEDGESRPCPFSLARRARLRFEAHHHHAVNEFSSFLIAAYVVCDSGDFLNLEDIQPSWDEANLGILFLSSDGVFDQAFGQVEPVNAETGGAIVQRILNHSNALAAIQTKSAA